MLLNIILYKCQEILGINVLIRTFCEQIVSVDNNNNIHFRKVPKEKSLDLTAGIISHSTA